LNDTEVYWLHKRSDQRNYRLLHTKIERTLSLLQALQAKLNTKLKQGSFGRNVFVMVLGTALGQASTVLASPILTRLYGPEMFGVLGAFTAALTIAVVIASLRYEMAIPLAKDKSEAGNLIFLCFFVLISTTLLMCGLVAIFTPANFAWADFGILEPYRWWLPLGFFLLGCYQIMVFVATHQQDYKSLAQTKIYQGFSGPFSQIAMGLMSFGTIGLIVGFIIGQSMGTTQLIWRLIVRKPAEHPRLDGTVLKDTAKRFQRFPLISSWSALVNVCGSSMLLPVTIPFLYSTTIAGYLFLTDRVIGRPLLMITTSIMQVYLGEISKNVTRDPLAVKKRFLQITLQQTLIVSAWLLVVNLLAGWLFPLAFGKEWGAAVPYLHVLSIALLPQFVTHAMTHTLQILQRQALSASWEIGRLIVVAGALIISAMIGLNALEAVLVYSLCQAAAQIVLLVLMYHAIAQLQPQTQDDPQEDVL
jgi:O-antigen/teichoic acid export membrane protein